MDKMNLQQRFTENPRLAPMKCCQQIAMREGYLDAGIGTLCVGALTKFGRAAPNTIVVSALSKSAHCAISNGI